MPKLTEMEEKLLRMQREGKNAKAVSQPGPGGVPIVSLVENATTNFFTPPPAAPQPQATAPLPPPAPETTVATQEQTQEVALTHDDLQSFAALALGDSEPPTPAAAPVTTPAKAESAASEASTTGIQMSHCPYCNWELSKAVEDVPTEADKEEFMRSLLGERRFERGFQYMGGRCEIGIRNMLISEEEEVQDKIDKIAQNTARTFSELKLHYNVLRLPYMVKFIKIDSTRIDIPDIQSKSFPCPEGKTFAEAVYDKHLAKLPKAIFSLLYRSLVSFDNIMGVLVARAADPDFWSPSAPSA